MLRGLARARCAGLLAGAARACSSSTLMAALIERIPVLTPKADAFVAECEELQEKRKQSMHKLYPSQLTVAEEGPDRERVRKQIEALIEGEATREGEGDRTGDLTSTDRLLAQRLYLVHKVEGQWKFPQVHGERGWWWGRTVGAEVQGKRSHRMVLDDRDARLPLSSHTTALAAPLVLKCHAFCSDSAAGAVAAAGERWRGSLPALER